MLLNDKIQIPFVNTGTTTVRAGDALVMGTLLSYQGIVGVSVTDVDPGQSGLLETSGIFSFDETDVKTVRKYQQVYCIKSESNKAKFTLSLQDAYVYAGISLTDRATEGGPLVLALGYNSPVYKAPTSGGSSTTSGGTSGAMGDSSTTVDPSNSSEPGAM